MFYYLSFLRPPPQQIPLGTPVKITPQIANDLRTERYPGSHDIFYSWSLASLEAHSLNRTVLPRVTKPIKLTTWRESSAYRELAVPAPQGAREGQHYQLVLLSQPQGKPHVVNLGGLGSSPFSVMSMPILFSSRSRGSTSKQEQVERIYRLPTSSTSQVFISIQEQTSFDLDKKVWDSGIGLSSWLSDLASFPRDDLPRLCIELRAILSAKNCNIIELGTGTGIVSIALGAIRAVLGGPGISGALIASDLATAMSLLEKNIATNSSAFTSEAQKPQSSILDWDDEHLPSDILRLTAELDLIVMADVAYNTASFDSLIRTIRRLVHNCDRPEGVKAPLILLGYKERDVDERRLWDMLESINVILQKVGEIHGAGGLPVEIWLGRPSARAQN